MFSKEQIDEWIALAETGINKKDADAYSNDSLKLRVLEAKVQTDRWGTVATDIVIHSSHKEKFREALGSSLLVSNEPITVENASGLKSLLERLRSFVSTGGFPIITSSDKDSLWGSDVHYSEDIPENKGLVLVLEDGELVPYLYDECDEITDVERSVACFPV